MMFLGGGATSAASSPSSSPAMRPVTEAWHTDANSGSASDSSLAPSPLTGWPSVSNSSRPGAPPNSRTMGPAW